MSRAQVLWSGRVIPQVTSQAFPTERHIFRSVRRDSPHEAWQATRRDRAEIPAHSERQAIVSDRAAAMQARRASSQGAPTAIDGSTRANEANSTTRRDLLVAARPGHGSCCQLGFSRQKLIVRKTGVPRVHEESSLDEEKKDNSGIALSIVGR